MLEFVNPVEGFHWQMNIEQPANFFIICCLSIPPYRQSNVKVIFLNVVLQNKIIKGAAQGEIRSPAA